MSTEIRPLELLQKYEREPTPQHIYGGDHQREKQRDHADRVAIARQALTGKLDPKHFTDEVRSDLVENYLFSEKELDELVEAAAVAQEEAREKRRRRDLADQLRAAKREAEHEIKAEEEAERAARIEALARRNLGWPKTGFPE